MPTAAMKSKGVLLQRSGGGSPDVFATIAEVLSFDGPSRTLPVEDATSFDSNWAESIAGIPDGGQVTFGMNLIPSNTVQNALAEDLENATLRAYRLVFTDTGSSKLEFSGYVTAFSSSSGGPNSKINASCTIRVSGGVS